MYTCKHQVNGCCALFFRYWEDIIKRGATADTSQPHFLQRRLPEPYIPYNLIWLHGTLFGFHCLILTWQGSHLGITAICLFPAICRFPAFISSAEFIKSLLGISAAYEVSNSAINKRHTCTTFPSSEKGSTLPLWYSTVLMLFQMQSKNVWLFYECFAVIKESI